MDTVWGIKWPIPTAIDAVIIIILILVSILSIFFLRYYFNYKTRKSHEYQLFLFKAKRLGLSNYKIKILHEIIESLGLKKPLRIMTDPSLFEKAILKFHSFLKIHNESFESRCSIYREIVIIYEKIYHPTSYIKELEKIQDIEDNQLLYITIDKNIVAIGIIKSIVNYLTVYLFENTKDMRGINEGSAVNVFLWRAGDAEYTFMSIISKIYRNTIEIAIPKKFKRGKEIRVPDINVNLQCSLFPIKETIPSKQIKEGESTTDDFDVIENEESTDNPIEGVIIKLNIDEGTVRLLEHIDHKILLFIQFELMDFMVKIKCSFLYEKKSTGNDTYYYTFKFIEISDAAREILHNYIIENS